MSESSSARFGWPWGDNRPSTRRRILLATLVAIACGLFVLRGPSVGGTVHTDFGQVWFGATKMLQGLSPYEISGPGREYDWDWAVLYPGTSFVLAAPLTILTQSLASAVFVAISVWLLVYGATRDSWHRLPAFASAAFVIAFRAAQWSPLLSAGLFIPGVAIAWAAKPTLGLGFFVAAPTGRHRMYCAIGGLALLAISLLLLPSWPLSWWERVKETHHMVPPLLQPAGFLLLGLLLRWRRKEAALLLAMALVPQSPSIYDALPILLFIPNTYREASALSLISSIGALLMLQVPEVDAQEFVKWRGALLVATTYLPAMAIVMTRPNRADALPWTAPSRTETESRS